MLKRVFLPVILLLLAYALWWNSNLRIIAAGVAIFLFGMLSLEDGFRAFTGGLLERILHRTTSSLPKSIGFGVVTTTIMQSSSLVSVITISFLSAGLIDLASGIGIIFGANIGTTTGAWLVAGFGLKVKLSAYAMPMLVFGIVLVFQRSRAAKGIGHVLAGLGFLFLGIHYMKDGFEAYRSTIDLAAYAMPGLAGLLVFTFIGVAATVIMQSSHATLVLIITALSSGQITYENALALAIGANIGTTITAILGALSANQDGKRLAGAHLIFNVITGLVALVFIDQFVAAVELSSNWVGIAADDYTLKLAVFHTLFNVVGVVLMVPFVGRMVRFLERRFTGGGVDYSKPHFLAEAVIEFPETLLEAVRRESLHLYENALELLTHALSLRRRDVLSDRPISEVVAESRSPMDIEIDERYVARVKVLYAAILEFISRAQVQIPVDSAAQLFELRRACGAVVTSVKEVKHLRKNVLANLNTPRPAVRAMYDEMRAQIVAVIRDLEGLRGDGVTDVYDLDVHRDRLTETDLTESGRLDAMLRADEINAVVAASLLNDQAYTRKIVESLVLFGSVVHGARDADERALEHVITMDDDDGDWATESPAKA